MKRLLTTLVPALALGWASLAMAQPPADPQAQADTRTLQAQAPLGTGEEARQAGCVRETGSRLRNHARAEYERCLAGRSFDREDIDRTGEMDLARAIRKLDPSIR